MAGLERTARLAGEAFGHEELGRIDSLGLAAAPSTRWLRSLAALLSAIGLSLHAPR